MQRIIPALAALVGIGALLALPVAAVLAAMHGWLPTTITKYDLRPFRFSGLAAQVWACRVWFGAWTVVAALGAVALVNAARTQPRRPLLWISLPIILGTACHLTAVTARATSGVAIPVAGLPGLERLVHVQFPPGTRLVEGQCLWGMDIGAEAVLTMPRAQVLPFLRGPVPSGASYGASSSGADLKLSRTDRSDILRWATRVVSRRHWQPETARCFVTARAESRGSNGRVYVLLADLDDPELATVYLEYATY